MDTEDNIITFEMSEEEYKAVKELWASFVGRRMSPLIYGHFFQRGFFVLPWLAGSGFPFYVVLELMLLISPTSFPPPSDRIFFLLRMALAISGLAFMVLHGPTFVYSLTFAKIPPVPPKKDIEGGWIGQTIELVLTFIVIPLLVTFASWFGYFGLVEVHLADEEFIIQMINLGFIIALLQILVRRQSNWQGIISWTHDFKPKKRK